MLLSRYLKITFLAHLVEREIIHRGGNAAYISGNHPIMYDSFLHRFNATLERPDVTYMEARRTVREQLLQLADHVYMHWVTCNTNATNHIAGQRIFRFCLCWRYFNNKGG